MKRRDFITLLGGTAAVWSHAARAQQTERMRRIGVLAAGAESDPTAQSTIASFRQGLQELGWTEGRNLRIDYRGGGGDANLIRRYAAELVALAPDAILADAGTTAVPQLADDFLHRRPRTVPPRVLHGEAGCRNVVAGAAE